MPRGSRDQDGGLRILFLMSALGRGGAQRQAVATAIGLRERGHDVTFVVLRPGGPLGADLREAGVPVVESGVHGRFGAIVGRLRLMSSSLLSDADVVYAFMPAANVTASAIGLVRRRPRVVWGIRDSGLELHRYGRGTRLIAALADRWRNHVALIICNSRTARRIYVDRGYPPDRTIVIPNGIDVERFSPAPSAGSGRESLGLAREARVVLCLARADPMKGQRDLVEAFGLVSGRLDRVHLVLVGDHDASFAAEIQALVGELGLGPSVSVRPGDDRPEDWLRAADVVVLASHYGEGFPNVLGEALACGTPVVTTDVGDAATVAGAHGEVVPPTDVPRLAAAIEAVLREPSRYGDPAERHARIAEEFSVERLISATERALIDVSARRRRPA